MRTNHQDDDFNNILLLKSCYKQYDKIYQKKTTKGRKDIKIKNTPIDNNKINELQF